MQPFLFDDVLVLDAKQRVVGSARNQGALADQAALEEPHARRQALPDGSTLVSVPSAGVEPERVFARAVVHEIRSPLNALGLYLEVARSRLQRGTQDERMSAEAALQKAAHQIGRADEVLRSFLDLWAPDPSKPGDLATLARAAGRLASHVATRRRVALEVEVPDGAAVVATPGRALADALLILLEEALVDASEASGDVPPGTVRVSLEAGDEVWLRVQVQGTQPMDWVRATRSFMGLGARVERGPETFAAGFPPGE